MKMVAYAVSGTTYDFYAFDEDGGVWNGSAFVSWSDAAYQTYRIAAVEAGTSGRFLAEAPDGATSYVLRQRADTLAASWPIWEDKLDSASAASTAAEVWTYAKRRLTMTATEVAAALQGDKLTIRKADTYEQEIPVGEDLSDCHQVIWTLKRTPADEDEESIAQIAKVGGLLCLNGRVPDDPALGSLAFNVTAEEVVIYIHQDATAVLCPHDNCVWDVKKFPTGDAVTVVEGIAVVGSTVTRATR